MLKHPFNFLTKRNLVILSVALAIGLCVVLIKEEYFGGPAPDKLEELLGKTDVVFTGYFGKVDVCVIDEIVYKNSNFNFPKAPGDKCPVGTIPIDRYSQPSGEGAVFFVRKESTRPYKSFYIENGVLPEYSQIPVETFIQRIVETAEKQLTN